MLKIRTPAGMAGLRVAGVYYDYTSDRGLMMMDRRVFDRWWHDPGVNSAAVYLKPGADLARRRPGARDGGAARGLIVYTNRALRERILAVFDQTFAVTGVIKVIAVLVAIVGDIPGADCAGDRAGAGDRRSTGNRGVARAGEGDAAERGGAAGDGGKRVGNRSRDVPCDGADVGSEQGVLWVDDRVAMALGDDRGDPGVDHRGGDACGTGPAWQAGEWK